MGYSAALVEACLGMPQVYQNFTKGCYGLSPFLFVTWLVGDIAKGSAFFATGAPFPFILCSIFQSIVDIVIILQIVKDNYISKPPQTQNNSAEALHQL